MFLFEDTIEVPRPAGGACLLDHFRRFCSRRFPNGITPIRFVVTKSTECHYECEVGLVSGLPSRYSVPVDQVFDFRRRRSENTERFNVVLMVPTGIGAEIGGHAGDAGPISRMLAEVSDTVVLHPNVVNASDINEMPENSLYVEGSILTKLLMGTIGLQPIRQNRILVAIDDHPVKTYLHAAVNAVNGARAAFGLSCPGIVRLTPPIKMSADFAPSGRSGGRVEQLEGICELLSDLRGRYDAVALSSVIKVPHEYHQGYFDAQGNMVNPWGGVEAILTHTLSTVFNIPTAHSPMFESHEVANMDPGIVDPRMAAEAVSVTFLPCILKGLNRSPSIIQDSQALHQHHILSVEDISCLVIPNGCLGLPTIAALEQGITVIEVGENRNLMNNDLSVLPWKQGQFIRVRNYWESAGIISCLRAGIDPMSVRRPFKNCRISVNDESIYNSPIESKLIDNNEERFQFYSSLPDK